MKKSLPEALRRLFASDRNKPSAEIHAGVFCRLKFFVYMAFMLGAAGLLHADVENPAFSNTIAAMSVVIDEQMLARGVKGLSVALVESNAIVWSQGFGQAVVESNIAATAQTVYRIGSVSKILTTACILKLWEDGRVDLEASITNNLPEYATLPRFAPARAPTLRECINHQSGLPGDLFRDGFSTAPWDGYNGWLLAELAADYPNYPPAFRSVYCNTGFQMAEEIVRRVSGSTMYDYAESNFFGPMAMTSSSFIKNKPAIAAQRAHAYASGAALPEEFVNLRGTGGMYSSVEDMAAVIRMILAGGRFNATNLLATNIIAAMMTDQTTNLPMDVTSGFRPGLGWDTLDDNQLDYAGRLCQKDGQTFSYYCSLIILRDRQLGVVVMNNSPDDLPGVIAHETLKQALIERDGLHQPTNFTPVVTAATNWSAGTIAAVTGLYVTTEGMDSGYDFLEAAPDGSLTWTVKAQLETPIIFTGLLPHADGWLYASNAPYPRLQPTNINGHAVLVYGGAEVYGESQQFRGDLYTPPPISAAWSNRMQATWWPVDMPPTDLYWTYARLGTDLSLRLTNRDNLIWLTSPSGNFVIAPSNDVLGFAAGSAVRRGASVVIAETNGVEELRYSSYTYRPTGSFPTLAEGVFSNGTLLPDRIQWFSFNAVSGVYYGAVFSNQSANALLKLGDADWSAGQTGWTCSSNGAYLLGLSCTSATPYAVRLYTLTNTIAQTTAAIMDMMAEAQVPALSIALVDGANVVWAQGFGMANREAGRPADADTIYRIASMSKSFATMSVLKLQEGGALNIADNITNTIPYFAMLPRFTNEFISIRSLLAHQSGIVGTYYKNAETTVQQINYYDTVIQSLACDYPLDPPGVYGEYNNNGFSLLEGVVQGGSGGTNFCDFTRAAILQPMGLSNTIFTLDNAQHERLARFYKDDGLMPDEYVNAFASGGLYSSVNDLAHWAKFLLNYGTYNGISILTSNSFNTIWTSQSDHVNMRQYDKSFNFGLGWDQVADPQFAYADDRVCMKDGACEGYGSSIMVIPGKQLGVVALNSFPGDSVVQPIARLALRLALEEARGLTAPTNLPTLPITPVSALTTNAVAALAGIYATGVGYDIITGNTNSLVWIANAHTATPIIFTNLPLHEDGWFYPATGTPTIQISFTNTDNRTFLKYRVVYNSWLETKVQSEQFVPAPITVAWSNRIAKTWIVADLDPNDYRWINDPDFRMNLRITNGVLLISGFGGSATLQPQSNDLAFPFAVGSAEVSALQARQTNGYEILHYVGFDFRALEDLPVLQTGTSATGTLAVGEVALFQFNVTTSVYHNIYVTPGNLDSHLRSLSDPSDFSDLSGITTTGRYLFTLQSTSATPYSIRLYTLTNTIARVTSLIADRMAEYNLVGCGISLVDGAHTVWETGFGYADLEYGLPSDKDTIFMIGSCSKTFGAIAAMQLVERGLLDLDAPLTNALPSFSIHQRFAGNVITPRTILTHHSGLPGDIFNGGFTVRPNTAAPNQLEAMLADEYTLMPTNTFWSYNNSGLVMLGLAIEHLSGMSADDYASSNLFQRMGMTNSLLRRSADFDFQRIARPYAEGRRCPEEYCNLDFAGSILSSASDMARYMKTLLAGGMGENARVISNNSFNAMLVKQNSGVPLDQFSSMLNMGIGFVLDPPWLNYMGKVCWHDGGTLYFRTLLRVATEAQLGCFISWNTAEAAAVNTEIVDSALKWAYEEKTGVAPPAPCEPGTPSAAIAPPETIALATGGVFVTGSGYDIFATNDTGLIAHLNAQAGSPSDTALVYRDNGWFTPTNSYATQFQFTQSVGRILCIVKNFGNGVTNTGVYGERSSGISPYNSAWSNRLGRWWATDMYPDDISWLYPGSMTVAMLDLSTKDNLLLLSTSESFVMSATNDVIAFAAGLGRNKGSALRVVVTNSAETLAFMGVHYQSADSIPVLLPGASTNGMTTGNGTAWFSMPAPTGATFTVDLATESDITAWLYGANSAYLGQANRAHAYRFDATNAQPLMIAVVRDGANTGPWRLTIHTNATPFYQALPFAQWPTALAEKSNLFPNTDFGYIFVNENRTNRTGNLLKIAIARMNSPNPAAQPIFFCSGGPGDSGILNTYQYFLKPLTNDYAVYLVDQRGLGFSQPSLATNVYESPSDMQYRLTMLLGGDLSAINTLESSRDFDDLAATFAITNANLHGISYGTLLAQTIMRREPGWLRAVILDGVVAPNIPPLSQTGPMRDNALNALFADIAAHPHASVYYTNFPTTFYTLANNLQNHPVTIQYSGVTNQVDGLAYLGAVLQQMTVSDFGTRERIPNIAYRAAAGETAALAELYTGFSMDTNVLIQMVASDAMQMTIINHDLLPFDSMAAASNACADLPPLLRQLNLNFMQQVVDAASLFDPAGQADPSFILPVTSAIPTLVINGTYDTQTGTNWAAEVARHLPNGHLVIVPTVGHGVLYGGPYPMQIIRDFLADPAQAPDTSCLTNLYMDFPAPWPTNTPVLAIGQPATNTFAYAGEAVWYRFTAVSGLYYNIGVDLGGSYARIVDANGRNTGRNGASEWSWLAPANGEYYAWLIAGTSGVARLDWTCPLMVRGIRATEGSIVFDWQCATNAAFDVWMATNLTDRNSFVKIATNLPSSGWINSFSNRMYAPSAFLFPAKTTP